MGLGDGLNDPNKNQMVVADCVKLIDDLVASTSGISGLGLKAGYAAVKGINPGFVPAAIKRLLPEFFAALDPIWNEGTQTGDPVGYLTQNSDRTADALLGVTDARIKKTQSSLLRGTYDKLRASAKGHVERGIPDLAKIIDNYTKV
ncbi:MAG TPA: hypothetical protein V6D12_03415 [Candidatus Obscuribacterales bacterium]